MSFSKIKVNGALIEKEFFEENIQEARAYSWVEQPMVKINDHSHCIVCTIALPNNESDRVFVSGSFLLCHSCYMILDKKGQSHEKDAS